MKLGNIDCGAGLRVELYDANLEAASFHFNFDPITTPDDSAFDLSLTGQDDLVSSLDSLIAAIANGVAVSTEDISARLKVILEEAKQMYAEVDSVDWTAPEPPSPVTLTRDEMNQLVEAWNTAESRRLKELVGTPL